MKDISLKRAFDSLETEHKAIKDIIGYLDKKSFSEAVESITECNHIITCASGSSGIAAKKFAHSLCCIERPASFLPPGEAVHGGLGRVRKDDVFIFVSRGGKTAELLPVLDVCLKKKVTIITITENLDSPLAKNSHIVLQLKIEKESDKYNTMATSSFIATIALFDAMLSAIMEESGYKLEQFALIHPGGAVGENLNRK